MLKHCPDCSAEKNKEEFGRASPRCRVCAAIRLKRKQREASARWHERNPDYRAESNKAFYAANRERERARAQAFRLANPEKKKRTTKAWREANKERFAEISKAWFAANKDYRSAYRKAQYAERRERENDLSRKYKEKHKAELARKASEFLKAHPEVNRYRVSVRRAAQMQAMPAWADKEAIKAIYEEAVARTAATGIVHHVDHIVPIRSKWVCGLHVENNLQILTAHENQSKSNRFWPDMPEELRS